MTTGVRFLLLSTCIAFVVQLALDAVTGHGFTSLFSLSGMGIRRGYLWQVATYMFLHANLWHIFLNMLGLYLLGPETERAMGSRRFLVLYFVSGVLGGVGWVFFSRDPFASCLGASGALFGILGAFAALYPDRPITVLVFFVLPVTVKAWVLAASLGVITLLFLLTSYGGNIAYGAHLAGGIAGYFYTLAAFRGRGFGWWSRVGSSLWQRVRSRPQVSSGELDRVLDKIATQGMNSLTRAERALLERASRKRREEQ
jgi:membrane associated rhomboid family serine protease